MRYLLLSCALLLFFLTASFSYAHILSVDGAMGVTLHVDPQDEPLAGVPSRIYVLFSPKSGTYFALEHCDCRLRIEKGGTQLVEMSVTHEAEHAGDSHVLTYAFPERGVYRVVVEGASASGPLFDPFSVHFDLRVAEVGVTGEDTDTLGWLLKFHLIHLILIGGACVVAVYLIVKDRKERTNSPSQNT